MDAIDLVAIIDPIEANTLVGHEGWTKLLDGWHDPVNELVDAPPRNPIPGLFTPLEPRQIAREIASIGTQESILRRA